MESPEDPGVFVVYGRNVNAYREMRKFLSTVGAREWTFEDASDAQANSFVTEIVLHCIERASAVIVLFTADELAALYKAERLAGRNSETVDEFRWQPRPNVIFEAGVAFGKKRKETIIVAVGRDVSGFSDIAGVHLVRLTNRQGKQSLRRRLAGIIKGMPEQLRDDWEDPVFSGDFDACTIKRWPIYDELQDLEGTLRGRSVARKDKKKGRKQSKVSYTLFEIICEVLSEGLA